MKPETIKTLVSDAFEALHKCGRYDAAARIVPYLDALIPLDESLAEQGVFTVLDYPFKWKDSAEGKEYWKAVYEVLAFETGTAFRKEVNKLLESTGLDDHEPWHALELRRLELDSSSRDMGTAFPSFKDTVNVTVDSAVAFEGDPRWLDLLYRFSSSEIVDFVSRVEFENPFKIRKGDSKRMFVKPKTKTPKGWVLLGEASGEVVIHPDHEETDMAEEIGGDWYLYFDDRPTRGVHAVNKKDEGIIVSSSFNEAMNRIFRNEPDLMSEAARLAFLHDKVELKLEFKE